MPKEDKLELVEAEELPGESAGSSGVQPAVAILLQPPTDNIGQPVPTTKSIGTQSDTAIEIATQTDDEPPMVVTRQPTVVTRQQTVVTRQPAAFQGIPRSRVIEGSGVKKPPSYLWLSCFVYWCCCCIVGGIAFGFSALSFEAAEVGDMEEAGSKGQSALYISIIGICFGSIGWICFIVFFTGGFI